MPVNLIEQVQGFTWWNVWLCQWPIGLANASGLLVRQINNAQGDESRGHWRRTKSLDNNEVQLCRTTEESIHKPFLTLA